MPVTHLPPPDAAALQAAILGWYERHGRSLAFRRRRDAYAVLVSEAMAQQTQISRVEPAWEAFLDRFPTVASLADAPLADVLRAWQGMGYNRRALNLQRAAQVVVREHGGELPRTIADLERLPGVGPYTARAVAAIAFGLPVGAVDTNVRRVLGRVAGGWGGLDARELQALADAMVPADRAGEWTHALMDVGATFCRPRSPRCEACPAQAWCRAAASPRAGEADRAVGVGSAVPSAPSAPPRPSAPFRSTSRWLRGRLVDLARAQDGDGWIRVDVALEPHPAAAVQVAAQALAREGLLELHPADAARARLPR